MTEPLNIPPTWVQCTLGEVVNYGATAKAEPDEIPEDAWILELEDIEKDTSKLLRRVTFAERNSKSTKNQFEPGDVLYGKLRPYLNKVILADRPGFCTTEIIPLRAPEGVDRSYLFYWMRHPRFLEHVTAVSHGLNMPRLGTEAGKAAPLVLAPTNEQRRIADKLDALMLRVDACRERLDRASGILKRFRQAVLAAAFRGDLTADWRAARAPGTVEPASVLLDRIRAERRQAWEEANPRKKYVEPEPVDTDGLPEVPEGWCWTRVECLSEPSGVFDGARDHGSATAEQYNLRTADYTDAGVRVVRLENLGHLAFHADRRTYISPEKYSGLMQREVLATDILVGSFVAEAALRIATVPADLEKAICKADVFTVRPLTAVNHEYLTLMLASSQVFQSYQATSHGITRPRITTRQLAGTLVPWAPAEEQRSIVERVSTSLLSLQQVSIRAGGIRGDIDSLDQSLLAKAFRGELVPQDPNDEPASELLARIQATTVQPVAVRPVRQATIRKRQPSKERSSMSKTRNDDDVRNKPYLAQHLRTLGGKARVEDLYNASELGLADFYKQLSWEVDQGHIRDARSQLEAT